MPLDKASQTRFFSLSEKSERDLPESERENGWWVAYRSSLHLCNPSLMDHYSFKRPQRDGWLSWPCWMTDSGRLTHKVVTRPAISLAQDRESSPARTGVLTTMLRHQLITNLSHNNTPDETNGINNAVSCYKETAQFSASFVTSVFASFWQNLRYGKEFCIFSLGSFFANTPRVQLTGVH